MSDNTFLANRHILLLGGGFGKVSAFGTEFVEVFIEDGYLLPVASIERKLPLADDFINLLSCCYVNVTRSDIGIIAPRRKHVIAVALLECAYRIKCFDTKRSGYRYIKALHIPKEPLKFLNLKRVIGKIDAHIVTQIEARTALALRRYDKLVANLGIVTIC